MTALLSINMSASLLSSASHVSLYPGELSVSISSSVEQ